MEAAVRPVRGRGRRVQRVGHAHGLAGRGGLGEPGAGALLTGRLLARQAVLRVVQDGDARVGLRQPRVAHHDVERVRRARLVVEGARHDQLLGARLGGRALARGRLAVLPPPRGVGGVAPRERLVGARPAAVVVVRDAVLGGARPVLGVVPLAVRRLGRPLLARPPRDGRRQLSAVAGAVGALVARLAEPRPRAALRRPRGGGPRSSRHTGHAYAPVVLAHAEALPPELELAAPRRVAGRATAPARVGAPVCVGAARRGGRGAGAGRGAGPTRVVLGLQREALGRPQHAHVVLAHAEPRCAELGRAALVGVAGAAAATAGLGALALLAVVVAVVLVVAHGRQHRRRGRGRRRAAREGGPRGHLDLLGAGRVLAHHVKEALPRVVVSHREEPRVAARRPLLAAAAVLAAPLRLVAAVGHLFLVQRALHLARLVRTTAVAPVCHGRQRAPALGLGRLLVAPPLRGDGAAAGAAAVGEGRGGGAEHRLAGVDLERHGLPRVRVLGVEARDDRLDRVVLLHEQRRPARYGERGRLVDVDDEDGDEGRVGERARRAAVGDPHHELIHRLGLEVKPRLARAAHAHRDLTFPVDGERVVGVALENLERMLLPPVWVFPLEAAPDARARGGVLGDEAGLGLHHRPLVDVEDLDPHVGAVLEPGLVAGRHLEMVPAALLVVERLAGGDFDLARVRVEVKHAAAVALLDRVVQALPEPAVGAHLAAVRPPHRRPSVVPPVRAARRVPPVPVKPVAVAGPPRGAARGAPRQLVFAAEPLVPRGHAAGPCPLAVGVGHEGVPRQVGGA